MNKTIWKFPLKATERQNIMMPKGAEILTVQTQHEIAVLYALVDPDASVEGRHIEVFATGEPLGYDMGVEREYIGTFQVKGGSLVFHVFEYTGV